jgi:hypothetical protein
MHLLRWLLMLWLAVGTATLLFLFWLCKRTARLTSTQNKPVLDQNTFQHLLAAAYAMQEQNGVVTKEAKADLLTTLGEELPSSRDRMVGKRIRQTSEISWRIATAVVIVAVSALLLIPASHRWREVPFRRTLPQSGTIATKVAMMEPSATKTDPLANGTAPTVQAMITKRHSAHKGEVEIIAHDTVVRYNMATERHVLTDTPTGRALSVRIVNRKRYFAHQSEDDIVAHDTVVRYNGTADFR